MENVKIRSAKKNDISIILGLLTELGRPKPKKDTDVEDFRKLVNKYLKDSDKEILVAENNLIEIVGFASIIFLTRLNQNNFEMYIPEIIIHKKYQKQGIGKKLINSCISIAKEKKCHRIRLESGNQRKESHKFYSNLGFKQSALSFSKNLRS